jgi:hypothetical protein
MFDAGPIGKIHVRESLDVAGVEKRGRVFLYGNGNKQQV